MTRKNFAAFAAVLALSCPAFATVLGNPPPAVYSCPGGVSIFTIPFPYLAASQVVATQTTSGVTTTVFGTVKPSIAPASGTLTLSAACPNGATLTISRVVPLTQPTPFRTGSYSGATHEQAFDRLEMQIQQNAATHATDKTAQAAKDAIQDTAIAAAINPTPATVNSNSLVIASNSTASRTLAARAAESRNVMDFGALGNGSTDDSTAIQAAINATPANGTVSFPPGTYVAKNIAVASTVDIRGAGRGETTLKLPALVALDGSPILNITASGVSIRGLTFDGQKSLQPADGFSDSFAGGTNGTGRAYRASVRAYNSGAEIVGLKIEDCTFQNAYGAAIATQNASHVKVRHNSFTGNNFEAADLTSTGATYLQQDVSFNEIRNTGSGHATVNGNAIVFTHASESMASHNEIDTVERSALKCEGCLRTSADYNVINNVTVNTFPAISFQIDCVGCSANGNLITNSNGGVTFGHVAGGTGFFSISVLNNVFDTMIGTQADGVDLSLGATSAGFTVSGNVMRNIGRYGVYMAAGAAYSNLVITNNNIQTIGGTNGVAGIRVVANTAGTTGVMVSHNLIDLNSSTSSDAAINFIQSAAQTIARGTIIGNSVINQAGRTTITDNNVALFTSGVFGANASDGFIRMGSTALQGVAPSGGGFSAGFQLAGIQPTAVTFANIGTPANGTLLYCSDCLAGSTPCTGASTGALAIRVNGAWRCQ